MIFDGSNDIVELGTGLFNGGESQLTISAWAKPETNSGHGKIITKKGTVNPRVFYLSVNGTDKNVYFFLTSTNYRYFYTANDSITVGEWVHIVATYNFATDTGKIYLNGAEVSTSSAGSTPDTSIGSNSIPTTIGRDGGSSADYFKGLINDVGIWDIALDSDSVTALYNSGVPLLPTSDSGNYDNSDNLQGYWRNDGIATWTDRANTGVASFDGSNDRLTAQNITLSGNDTYTFSAWIKPNATTMEGIIAIGNVYMSICVSAGYLEGRNYNSGAVLTNTDAHSITAGQWCHVVGVFTGGEVTLYKNGSSTSAVACANQSASNQPVYIGYGGTADYFNGQIANACLFNTALTASEVSELYAIDKRSSISGHSKFSSCVGSWLMGADSSDTTSTIQDQTSNNNDATVSGASLVGYNDGTATNATTSIVIPEGSTSGRDSQGFLLSDTTLITNGLRLNGSEYVEIQDSEVFDFGQNNFSIEYWINTSESTNVKIINQWDYSGTTTVWASSSFESRLSSNKLYARVSNGSSGVDVTSTTSVNDGDWHHIVFLRDGDTLRLYVDKTQEDTGDVTGITIPDTTRPIWIGKDISSGNIFFNGLIDEVRIYSKALSASEVTKNYNNGKSAHQ